MPRLVSIDGLADHDGDWHRRLKATLVSYFAVVKEAENKVEAANWTKFLAAKELMHVALDVSHILPADFIAELPTNLFWEKSQEALANDFAAQLLVPCIWHVPAGYPSADQRAEWKLSRRQQAKILRSFTEVQAEVPEEFDALWLAEFQQVLADGLRTLARLRVFVVSRIKATTAPSTCTWVHEHHLNTGISPPTGMNDAEPAPFIKSQLKERNHVSPYSGSAPGRHSRDARLPRPSGRTLPPRLPRDAQTACCTSVGRHLHPGRGATGWYLRDTRSRQMGHCFSVGARRRCEGLVVAPRLMRSHV